MLTFEAPDAIMPPPDSAMFNSTLELVSWSSDGPLYMDQLLK